MRSTWSRRLAGRDVQASRAARHPVLPAYTRTPDRLQASRTAALAGAPKISKGSTSGVTRLSSDLHAARVALGRGRQRQLVQRKRPARSAGLTNATLLDPAVPELAKQATVLVRVAGVAIGEHVLRLPLTLRVRTEREDEPVVVQLTAVLGDDHLPLVLDALEDTAVPSGVEIGRDVAAA